MRLPEAPAGTQVTSAEFFQNLVRSEGVGVHVDPNATSVGFFCSSLYATSIFVVLFVQASNSPLISPPTLTDPPIKHWLQELVEYAGLAEHSTALYSPRDQPILEDAIEDQVDDAALSIAISNGFTDPEIVVAVGWVLISVVFVLTVVPDWVVFTITFHWATLTFVVVSILDTDSAPKVGVIDIIDVITKTENNFCIVRKM